VPTVVTRQLALEVPAVARSVQTIFRPIDDRCACEPSETLLAGGRPPARSTVDGRP
jgi:hypothetical protein